MEQRRAVNLKERHQARNEIDSLVELKRAIAAHADLSYHVIHAVDVRGVHD